MGFDFVSFFPRAVMQGIPLLFGSTGEILTEKSGNLNLGIPGIMYVGGISGVIGSFFYEQAAGGQLNGFLAIMIPILCSLLGSLLMGLLYCFLTVTLRANQNVTGLAMTTFGVGVGNFFGGSLIKLTGSEVPSIALANTSVFFKTTLPGANSTGWFGQLFLSYGFLAYVAVIIALGASYFLNHTRPGLHLRAVGESASTADAAGINVTKYKYLATCIGSMIAGLGGLYYVMDYANGVWSNNAFGDRGWLAIALGASYFLNHTRPGLHLRAVGESASTADAAGINVTKYKYLATCIGSMIAGLGGLYYVMDYANGVWSNNAFGDRGWLAIALVIFTIWRPNVSILASILFGGLYIINMYLPTPGGQMAVKELYKMLPYLITLIVLIVVSLRKKREDQPPASLGLSYFREER